MQREIANTDGVTWTCVQAYTGLTEGTENKDAASVKGEQDNYWVVCTPSGGAKSVRLKLEGDWENTYSDEDLLNEITTQQQAE
ncbi:MAG TPA: hypothetical protein V6D15_16460 [Oculatellaceae cyanobacterium]|jgi:hypothetical protein